MASIGENLKLLRQASGMTQQEVANQMGVTRQTISSYESGRTQPDIETLKRFAEVYNVEFDDVVYGGNKMQKKLKLIKLMAKITLIVCVISNLAQSLLLWTANKYYVLNDGVITEQEMPIYNARKALMEARNDIDVFLLGSFFILSLIMIVQLSMIERPIAIGRCLKYCFVLIISSAVVIFPWAITDKIYGVWDYYESLIFNIKNMAVLLGVNYLYDLLSRKSRGRRYSNSASGD